MLRLFVLYFSVTITKSNKPTHALDASRHIPLVSGSSWRVASKVRLDTEDIRTSNKKLLRGGHRY